MAEVKEFNAVCDVQGKVVEFGFKLDPKGWTDSEINLLRHRLASGFAQFLKERADMDLLANYAVLAPVPTEVTEA